MATEPYLGETMLIAATNPPPGWMLANGQELSIMQHTALFAVIGARFGGDGRLTFALPDMESAIPTPAGMIWCVAVQGHVPFS